MDPGHSAVSYQRLCVKNHAHAETRRRICIPEAWHRLSRGFSKERRGGGREWKERDRAQNRGDEVLYKY